MQEKIPIILLLKEYRRDAVMTPVWVVLETIGELFLTVTIGRFIDALSAPGTGMDTVISYGLRLFVLAAACRTSSAIP